MKEANTILFHIGVTKTGSSFLQSCSSLNRSLLASYGIDYPSLGVTAEQMEYAAKGRVSGGNGTVIVRRLSGQLNGEIDDILKTSSSHLRDHTDLHCTLVSNEGLCNNVFSKKHRLARLADSCYNAGYVKIKCLLFVRNPFEHMASWYLEGLKGTGWAAKRTIEEYAESYKDLVTISNAIQNCIDIGIEIECRNYSYCKSNLLKIYLTWAGVNADTSFEGFMLPNRIVNRSLDHVEQALCSALAQAGVKPALFTSLLLDKHVFTGKLDNRPYIDPKALDVLQANNSKPAEAINRYLRDSEQIRFDASIFSQLPIDRIETSTEQLRAIASTFASLFKRYVPDGKWKIKA